MSLETRSKGRTCKAKKKILVVGSEVERNESDIQDGNALACGGSKGGLRKRLTRKSMKEWEKMLDPEGCSSGSGSVMGPPSLPVSNRGSSYGVLTRRRYKKMRSDGSLPTELHQGLKALHLSGSFDRASITSDYGTASEDSKNSSFRTELSPCHSPGNSCHCPSMSDVDSLSCDSDGITTIQEEDEMECDLSTAPWDSDASDNAGKPGGFDSEAELECFRHLRESMKVTYLKTEDVVAIIPTVNSSGYTGDFSINIKSGEGESLYRRGLWCGMRVHHVSAVVSMEPHGVQFHESFPALIVIRLAVEPADEAWLACLCSNTSDRQAPHWQRLPRKDYCYRHGSLVISTAHFSLFTVILEEPYPEVMRRVRCRPGGRLRLDDVPGVEVEFPRGCLAGDLDAYVRVLFDSEPSFGRGAEPRDLRALASPIVMLGPHGHQFDTARPPVRVTLPVPDYHRIVARFGPRAVLRVLQSSTREDEPMVWQDIGPPSVLPAPGAEPVVSFTVHHFSFFKLVWDILTQSLHEAKMGMSYFYPYISFSMMCQAFMDENPQNNRFGLEVICYRSDHHVPQTTNYRHRVGASLKPKLVRPGRIQVRLKSQMFEADVEAGEDEEMVKEETDFRGRDFEKQYACKFKQNVSVERGTFGKVSVDRVVNTSTKDPLFEFNLYKSGLESQTTTVTNSERWTHSAMTELASTLQITENNNWKKFAQYIGFTKNEIKSKFQYSSDPFLAMMNTYSERGGTPEEFIQALYAASRDLRLKMANISDSNRGDGSSHSDSRGSDSHASSSKDSGHSSQKKGTYFFMRPFSRPADDSDSDSPEELRKSRKRSSTGSGNKSSKAAKKLRMAQQQEKQDSDSGEGEGDDDSCLGGHPALSNERSLDEHRNNKYRLSDQDLWRVSSKFVRKDWRNLGRALGLPENVMVDLEHQHATVGFRECAYQMLLAWKGRSRRQQCTFGTLYSAMLAESMGDQAKYLVSAVDTTAPGPEQP
ncbi:uncharacterized protein LOC134535489 [Bacillus rossius redtenbacheri]|uniref:uncharacterized protein LOC134535489 n=1 Tax=Bacillus rossius redtenbacheri TaxID=93214 RepID=UPI002FDE2486